MSATAEKIEATNIVPMAGAALTPMDMLNRAVSQGANIDVLEKLMGLQERYEANQARKAFNDAIAAAKAEIKPIVRDKKGHNEKRYVSFDAIARMVDPILSKHDLIYRFRTEQIDGRINVTCILSHGIHHEETTLSGPADTSGNKNAIQAIGSTLTYLQRYSLVQMLGLASSDDDDAGTGGASEFISEEQMTALRTLIDETGADIQRFCAIFKIEGLALLPANRFEEAKTRLQKFAGQTRGAK